MFILASAVIMRGTSSLSCVAEVAQRVADELDTFLGAHVGYLIRFEDFLFCRMF